MTLVLTCKGMMPGNLLRKCNGHPQIAQILHSIVLAVALVEELIQACIYLAQAWRSNEAQVPALHASLHACHMLQQLWCFMPFTSLASLAEISIVHPVTSAA